MSICENQIAVRAAYPSGGSMGHRARSFAVSAALGLCVLVGAGSAHAKPEFPGIIAAQYQLSYLPPCGLCHAKGNVGSSTVRTPFGLALRARGLTAGGEDSLAQALSRLEADAADSDGDGVSDVAELKAGTDPNSAANASLIGNDDPGYGCGGSPPKPHSREASAPLLSGFVLAWILKRRRRSHA